MTKQRNPIKQITEVDQEKPSKPKELMFTEAEVNEIAYSYSTKRIINITGAVLFIFLGEIIGSIAMSQAIEIGKQIKQNIDEIKKGEENNEK